MAAAAENLKLKDWMKKENIFDNDLMMILEDEGVSFKEDLGSLTQKQWDEVIRRGKVERMKTLKDQKAKLQLEKKIKKIEKVWRSLSGIKSTSIQKGQKKKNDDKKEEEGLELKKWMKKEGIYDNDLYAILVEQGVLAVEGFDDYTQKQWDVFARRGKVERFKTLKDQKARLNLEKKVTKIEKVWRKRSGVSKTSIKKGGGKKKKNDDEKEAPPLANSAQAQQEAMTKGAELKKFLQKNGCYIVDLLMVCVERDICTEQDIEKIESNADYDEIMRQVRVARAKELKDNAARMRMEKQMTKFEKIWRTKTGVKKTSVQKGKKKKDKKSPKDANNDKMAGDGAALKKWMQKNDIWEMALFEELLSNDIKDPDLLAEVDQQKFDDIVRKVRVDRFSQLKDQNARNRADKLLVKFEKQWRKLSGIKSTSIKN